jgi:hypothetical protein
MKVILVTILNFILNPILFFHFLLWSRRLNYVPFKRIQYILFTANYTLFGFGYKQHIEQCKLIGLIFDLDYYMDQLLSKENHYENKISKLLLSKRFVKIVRTIESLQKPVIMEKLEEFVNTSYLLHNLQDVNIEKYLDITRVSIGVPCSAALVGELAKENLDNTYVNLAADIVRLINDIAGAKKDLKEGTKNSVNIFGFSFVTKILEIKLQDFKKYKIKTKVAIFLKRLVKISSLLYKSEQDFRL